MDLFTSKTYKDYLNFRLSVNGDRSGLKSRFATAVECQNAYVSQTLNGHQHFTLEQAERINRFFEHNDTESHFFMLLVERERAGTPELRRYYQKQLDGINKEQIQIKSRVPTRNKEISAHHLALYYSNWLYAGIHMALSIPELRSEKALEQAFKVSSNLLRKILTDLSSMGLIENDRKGVWITTPTYIHLEKNSPLLNQHFTNWRLKALENMQRSREEDLQYSVVFSASKEDLEKIREELMKAIQKILTTVKSSSEEVLAVFNLDLFVPIQMR